MLLHIFLGIIIHNSYNLQIINGLQSKNVGLTKRGFMDEKCVFISSNNENNYSIICSPIPKLVFSWTVNMNMIIFN